MSYSLDMRERAVSYVRNGGEATEASRLYKVARSTLYRWLGATSLEPKPAKTRRRKIDKEALRAHVRDCPDALLRERAEYFGVHVNAIWMALRKMKIVKKNDAVRRSLLRRQNEVLAKTAGMDCPTRESKRRLHG